MKYEDAKYNVNSCERFFHDIAIFSFLFFFNELLRSLLNYQIFEVVSII